MKLNDLAKAAGFALLLLFIDIAVAVAVVYTWGIYLEPGHSTDFYASAGIPIA